MIAVLGSLLQTLRGLAQSRAALHLEVLALRHQLQVLQRTRPWRVRLATADRWFWVWLSRVWTAWRTALVIVKPETVLAWHSSAFRLAWSCESRRRTGRPAVPRDVRTLIRTMSQANPLWGAPRIHGEPLKLDIAVSQATVAPPEDPSRATDKLPFGVDWPWSIHTRCGSSSESANRGRSRVSGPHVDVSNRAPSKCRWSFWQGQVVGGTGQRHEVQQITKEKQLPMIGRNSNHRTRNGLFSSTVDRRTAICAYTRATFAGGRCSISSCFVRRKLMRKLIGTVVALGVLVSVSAAAQKPGEQTWTGKISDSMCNEKHPGGEHEGKKMTEADCTKLCVKKGAKYVFVSDGKVYQLANQKSKTIESHAGEEVQLTGEMKGETITATKITTRAKPAK